MVPFVPLTSNPHLLTIAAGIWVRRLDTSSFPVEAKLYRTEPEVQVLVESQRPRTTALGDIVLVHGLEGSGQAGYMRSMSQTGLEAGFATHRFHMRSCGGTAHLCPTLYHAGLTSDLLSVLEQLHRQSGSPIYLVGYSLGGNVVLKLAGELGEQACRLIAGICALSTPINLAACARRMAQPENRIYDRRFLRTMLKRLRGMNRFPSASLRGVRSVFEFDDRFTAPSFGFSGAGHYYATQSADQFLERIRVPALLIQAKDDPLIPFEVFDHPAFRRSPHLQLIATEHGGHLGFLSRNRPRFWADHTVLEWVLQRRMYAHREARH